MDKKIGNQTGNIVNVGTAGNVPISGNVIHVTIQQQAGAPLSLSQTTPSSYAHGYITDSGADRYLLDDYPDDGEFEFYPNPLYVLSLYFITLAVPHEKRESEYYVVMDFVYYCPNVKNGRFNDEIWSVPYTIHAIDLKGKRVRSVREIKTVYAQELPGLKSTLATLEDSLFYNLGIVYKEIEKGREYIEYKRSATEPNKMRCNYVREFFVSAIDNNGLLNLIDPENLHQHRYLPLPLKAYEYNGFLHYMDKPMPANVTDVLLSKTKRLTDLAITVNRSRMVYERKGVLFRITYIVSTTASKSDYFFDPNLDDILETCLARNGIGWYQIEGNQILGALPQGMDTDALESGCTPQTARQFMGVLLDDIYQNVCAIAPWLKNKLCCSLAYGTFRYGKQYSLSSRRSSFEIDDDNHFRALHNGLLRLLDAMSCSPDCDNFGTVKGALENLFLHGILVGVDAEKNSLLLPHLKNCNPTHGSFEYEDGEKKRTLNYICRNDEGGI